MSIATTTTRRIAAVVTVLVLGVAFVAAPPVAAAGFDAPWQGSFFTAAIDGLFGWLGIGAPTPAAETEPPAGLQSVHAKIGSHFDPNGANSQGSGPTGPGMEESAPSPGN